MIYFGHAIQNIQQMSHKTSRITRHAQENESKTKNMLEKGVGSSPDLFNPTPKFILPFQSPSPNISEEKQTKTNSPPTISLL